MARGCSGLPSAAVTRVFRTMLRAPKSGHFQGKSAKSRRAWLAFDERSAWHARC
jgi:hypothetical protein